VVIQEGLWKRYEKRWKRSDPQTRWLYQEVKEVRRPRWMKPPLLIARNQDPVGIKIS
jgi:hypothetical protein